MPEPITFLAGLLTAAGTAAASGVVGNEAHRLFRLWLETATDPATRLPSNHDLNRASRESLRAAVQVLIYELARKVGLEPTCLTRLVEHGRWTAWLARPLFGDRPTPQQHWLDAFREAVAGKAFDAFHDSLRLRDAQVRACLRPGDLGAALGPPLAEQLLRWARAQVRSGTEPGVFEALVLQGWEVSAPGTPATPPVRLTLAQTYGLCLREHLKSDPRVFNLVVTDTLGALQTRLDQQGAQISSDLASLREAVARLAEHPPVFSQFEAWLTPQLGALRELLVDVGDQLDALARGQSELKAEQGEVLVVLVTLATEVRRGNAAAAQTLGELSARLQRFERKLDHLIGGLPIQRFQLPDPPTHELQLLQPKHRAVQLLGRETDLAALCAWVESDEPISARLLVGGAGTGKTRLAFELLLRVAAALPQWQAGLLLSEDLRRLVDKTQTPDFNWPAPTLLVVDYAQSLAAPLAKLLRALTHRRRDGRPPLRLLLLERRAGDWFDDLLRQDASVAPCPVRSLFHPPTPVALTPLPPGELRREVLKQTLEKAARLAGKTPSVLPPPGDADFHAALDRPLFDQPLNLMMAALAAGELGLLPALKRERLDLAVSLAERELRRIERFAPDPDNPAQKRVLRHLAACATLERGFTRKELDRAVREELAALQLAWHNGPGDLAERLQQALPGEHLPVAPVEPDFVGEALVLATLARADGAGSDRWRRLCDAVVRCCRRDPLATPATLLHAFQNFGHEPQYGEPLLTASDALIRAGLAATDPVLLLGLENALPHQTVELRRRAAEITRHLYKRLKEAMQKGRDNLKPEVARLANNLALRLSELGRRAEALGPAQEALKLYRALARANPDAFNPDLAMALVALGSVLAGDERGPQARACFAEGIQLLTPYFLALPEAHQPLMASLVEAYQLLSKALGEAPDAALLEPVQKVLQQLRRRRR